MIEIYVLERQNLDKFIEYSFTNQPSDNPELNLIVENSESYICEAHSNCYFLAKNIHQKVNKGMDLSSYISRVYNIMNEKNFFLEEIDSKFVNYILRHESNTEIELDMHLSELHEDYLNKNYGKQVCY